MTPPSDSLDAESDFDDAMYLDILRENPPLKSYVSRGDTRDSIDIPGPHEDVDRAIFRAIRFTMQDGIPRFQPILGSAGMGKTHLFWTLKDREDYFKKGRFLAVYVPSPPAPIRIPLHIHACIVDTAGEDIFNQAVDMLMMKFGGLRGVTHETYDYPYAMERLLVDYPGISADAMKTLLRYRLDPANSDLARRWLFGDALSNDEIVRLGVRTVLEEDDVTLATLKLLAEGSRLPIVLFIDEMEGPYNTHGEEAERRFFEVLKRLYNETRNMVIIASSLTEIWDRIYELADGPMKSRMERVVHLQPFEQDDVNEFIQETMKEFWTEQNVEPPPSLIFPFSDADINEIFANSEGVPRDAIRNAINRLDSILFEKVEEEVEEQPDYVVMLTPTVVISSLIKALELAGNEVGVEVAIDEDATAATKESTSVLILTKGPISRKVGIDVPGVKDWDRSGGVASFYSARRLQKLIEAGEINIAMMAVPEATAGAKFQAVVEDLGANLADLRFTETTATEFVEAIAKSRLPDATADLFTGLLERII
ncbi:MAG: hypothetical protein ACW974_05895 [Candidatus Thorarchaeota archaeon]|jgi:hypothetical protein